MRFRSLAIATTACILAACGPGGNSDPAAPTVAATPTAPPLEDPGPLPTDPGQYLPVDASASGVADIPASDVVESSPAPSMSPSPSPSPSPTATPTPSPTPTPVPTPALVDLQYTVTSKSHNSVLLQHFTCNVQIKNGSSVPRTGKVTVTFVHDATPEDGSPPATQVVSLSAGGTANLTFTDPKFHPLSEDAAVQVLTDPYVPSASPPPAVSFKDAVAPLLKLRCVGCHMPGGNGFGDVPIFTSTGDVNYAGVSGSIARMVNAVQAGEMPKGRAVLAANEIQALEQWEAAGAPNN